MLKISHWERLVPLGSVNSISLVVQDLHRSMIDKKLACLHVVSNSVASERAKLWGGKYIDLIVLAVRNSVLIWSQHAI